MLKIYKLMPGLKHLANYKQSNLIGDLTAGLIVAFLLIPQSMAYATIAGVPVSLGLFAATFPLIIYALFGTSKYLSVGPVSVVSLLAFSAVSSIAAPNSAQFLQLIIFLALLVGVLQFCMGLIKFGSIFDYVSPAFITGFTSAIAIIIALNQVKSIMGVSLPKYDNLVDYGMEILRHVSDINAYTALIGIGSILLLVTLKKMFTISPGPFIVIVLSIGLVDYFNLHQKNVDIVGQIPSGFPDLSMTIPTWDLILLLMPTAFMISFISFLESYAIGKTLANKENEQLDPNRELMGLGLANITSSAVGSIPIAGAISRSAVNHQSGAKTNLSLLITAFFMFVAILFLTPLFYYLPKATLAAIIIVAVSKLINLKQMIDYIKNKLSDGLILIATFLSTLMIDIFIGLLIGITVSLLVKGARSFA
ncbi:SulP family inorganic anion transporter [Oceanobacillus halotolerans]|uniref:SulP family inorganic anion transporter n=1 Tax=Oceanobacillus halotolerans TaxID=2663380 RepID=UPI0013D92645|nr:SulP family inorganic anion transporter [Oceanobacillus halotolerans]